MKLATFETITEIIPIEGADRIELARVQGWNSVIKKNEYKVGDQVIFVPIDTVLTPREWNKFLWDKNDPSKPIRVKIAKLRGVISSGLIFPRSLISAQEIFDHMDDPNEDVSIAGILGITKYEKNIPATLQGKVKGNFPTHLVSKTDEDNLNSNIEVLEELKQADFIESSLKKDGTSATYIKELDGTFRVCSRNLELEDGANVYWDMARKYNIEKVLPNGFSMAGEICGPGIQKNPVGLSEVCLYLFNYVNITTRECYSCYEYIFETPLNIPTVPLIKRWTKEEFSDMVIEGLQAYTNLMTYPNNKPAEGLVFRGIKDGKVMYSRKLQKMLSVKLINQNYEE